MVFHSLKYANPAEILDLDMNIVLAWISGCQSSLRISMTRIIYYLQPVVILTYIFIFKLAEEGFGEHQLPLGSGHEVRQVLPGLQADPEDSASGQGQADHHRQQHSPSKVISADGHNSGQSVNSLRKVTKQLYSAGPGSIWSHSLSSIKTRSVLD